MSVNRQVPHVLVLPEDDANRQLANGFQLHLSLATRRMQVLPEAGGWREVLDRFNSEHRPDMERNGNRFMILLLDFDGREDRLNEVRTSIPEHLQARVFVLGVWTEPEDLRQNFGSYETIGLAVANDCYDNTEVILTHELLRHNSAELDRLRTDVRRILFPLD